MGHKQRSRACLFLHGAQAFRPVAWKPAADVYRTPRGWLAKFELAGVRPEDIRVEVKGHSLLVQGVRRDTVYEESCHHYSLEIAYSPFARRIEFPVGLERASVRVDYAAGMLLVRIEPEEERP